MSDDFENGPNGPRLVRSGGGGDPVGRSHDDLLGAPVREERRFCSACVQFKPITAGAMIKQIKKGGHRWICAWCVDRIRKPEHALGR